MPAPYLQVRAPQVMISWDPAASVNSGVDWPRTKTPSWDNGGWTSVAVVSDGPVLPGAPDAGALKLVHPGTGTASIRIRSGVVPTPEFPGFSYPWFARKLGMWVYAEPAAATLGAACAIQWYLSAAADGTTTNSHMILLNRNFIPGGWSEGPRAGWSYLTCHSNDPNLWDGSATLPTDTSDLTLGNRPVPWSKWTKAGSGCVPTANLTGMQISFGSTGDNWQSGDAIYIKGIDVGHRAKPVVVLGWDNIHSDLTDFVEPLLTQYGMAGYFVVTEASTGTVESPNVDNINRGDYLLSKGWAALPHSRTHPVGGMPAVTQDDETFIGELGWCLDRMEQLGWWARGKPQSFPLPENITNRPVAARIARLYPDLLVCRGVVPRWAELHPWCGDQLFPDPMGIGCFNMGGRSLAQLKATVEYAIRLGCCVWPYGHNFDASTPANDESKTGNALTQYVDHFEAFVPWLAALRDAGIVEVMNPVEFLEQATFGRRTRALRGGTWESPG